MVIDNFEKEPYKFLSNFYPCEVMYFGEIYPTTEHAFQASKALYKKDQELIRNAKTPGESKKLGRKVCIIPNWDSLKLGVMRNILEIKFYLPEFREKLLETGDATLIEGNWWNDTFWGVCRGKGENNLGKLLMEIREELKQEDLRND